MGVPRSKSPVRAKALQKKGTKLTPPKINKKSATVTSTKKNIKKETPTKKTVAKKTSPKNDSTKKKTATKKDSPKQTKQDKKVGKTKAETKKAKDKTPTKNIPTKKKTAVTKADTKKAKETTPTKTTPTKKTTTTTTKGTKVIKSEVKNKKNQVAEAKPKTYTKRGRQSKDEVADQQAEKRTKLNVTHPTHLTDGGVVLALGEGDTGQLGLGPDVMERTKPGKVNMPKDVVQITAGGMHTVSLTKDGEVYTWGCNDEGALGRSTPDEDECMEPGKVTIPDDQKVVQVCAGDSHSAALTNKGRVYAWGTFRDANGSIGLTTNGKSETPVEMTPGLTVCRIASGSDHLACITTDGHLYTLGNAEQGQLGRVAECFSNRGGRKGLGFLLNPGQVHTNKRSMKFDNVWTGAYVTYVHSTTGEVYSWGLNNYFQLGFADMKNRYVPECAKSFDNKIQWRELAGGQHHTIALDSEGVVYSLGRKEYGRLGLGENTEEKAAPTPIKALEGKKCINVACGTAVSMAVTDDGEVYTWGMGTSKQLGNEDEEDLWEPVCLKGKQLQNRRSLQVTSGGQHTVILAKDNDA